MKKVLLFSLLLLAVGLAFATNYTIGTGTSSTSYSPFYGLYDYGWNKIIYTAAEINTAGLTGPADIYGFGFYAYNTPANYVMLDQKVYIRHTTLSSYGTATDETGTGYPAAAGFAQVFNADVVYNGLGWYYLMFSTPFAWNGTGNLEIFYENWDGDYYTGYPTHTYTATGTNYMTVYKYQDTTYPGTGTTGTRTYNRPNLRIVTSPVDAAIPATLVSPANGGYSLTNGTLVWNNSQGMASSYDVYFGTSSNPPLVANQVDMMYMPTMTAGSTYYWKIVSRNSEGPADSSPIWSFRTPGENQLFESFENTAFPPAGWGNPGTFTRSTTTPYHLAASAYKSTATPAMLFTPMLEITESSVLSFMARVTVTTGIGRIQIKTSENATEWNPIGDPIAMPANTNWNNYLVDLGPLAGTNQYIGFEVYSSTTTSAAIYIDFVIGPDLAPVEPNAVTLTAPANGATNVARTPTFTWTAAASGGIPTGYRVYCDTNVNPTTLIGNVTGTTFTATTGLPYNTLHYWKVVAFNNSGDAPASAVWSFTTLPDPTIYTLPWSEDFGTTGATFPPTNWTRWSGALANPSVLASGSTIWGQDNWLNDTSVTPVNWSARMNIYSTARYHWIMTPPIQMPGAGYQLEFDIGLTDYASTNPITSDPNGTTGVDDKFIVLIGDGVTWTPANVVRQWDNAGSPFVYNDIPHTGMHVTLPLDSYNGAYQVAFYGESTVSNADNDFFVDNVLVRQTPAGAPEHVTLTSPADGAVNVPKENVNLAWNPSLTGGTPAYFEVYVGENPIDPGIDYYGEYFYETTNPNLNLSAQEDIDLGYNTTWYWAVLPYNSAGVSPDPNSPAFMVWDFTTTPDPTITALPYEEYFDSVTAPALPYGWTGYVNSTASAAYVRTYNSTTYAQSAPNSAYLTNSTDASADLRLITPAIDLGRSLSQIKMKFYARSSTAGYPILIGTVSATDGTGVFTQIQSINLTAVKTEYEVSFANYVGTDQYICFKHGLGGTSRSLYVDNVRLLELLPVDLAATTISGPAILQAGTSYNYTVTVFNEGTTTINSYNVNLKKHGDDMLASVTVANPIAPGATAQVVVPWTPSVGGAYLIYGQVVATGDGNAANNNSPSSEVYILDNTMTVVAVGDDATTTSGYYVPINLYYRNGVTEELYFPDEMHLQSGLINAIVYKNTSTNARLDKAIKIWMAHTTAANLSGGWLPVDNYTLVFDGTVDFPAGVNYVVIPLTTPFNYTGGILATRVYRVFDSGSITSTEKFFYTTNPAHSTRSRYLYSDSTTYDPMAPSAAGTTLNYYPNTTFIVQNAVLQTGAVMNGYVYETGGTTPVPGATVTLTDERYATTTDATGFYEFLFWEAHTVSAVASKTDYYTSAPVTGIALTMGNTVTQNLFLQPLPSITVSGQVTSNDYPAGLVGATVKLYGYHNYEATTGAGGLFSIPNVKGNSAGSTYTWEAKKTGYITLTGSDPVYETNFNMGTLMLIEQLWPAYNLVATHNAGNANLVWDPAGEPDYLFFDFEEDNGGWVGSGYGDWQWTNAYTLTGYTDTDSSVDTPPAAPYSGNGLWGTKVLSSYSNSGAWSYLRKTVDMSGYANPVLKLWHYMNGFNTWDYGLIKVNGTTVWGSSALAVFMPWQELTVSLAAYQGMASVEISFEWYATTTVNYAGWYIDDIYIGPATRAEAAFGTRNSDRWFLNYAVYRMLASDENTPGNWTLLDGAVTDPSYLDTGFGSVPSAAYKWAVKANYSAGLQSEPLFSNPLSKVYDPDDISATKVGNNVVLSWTAEPAAAYYKIYSADDPYGAYTYLGYSQTNSFTITAPAAAKKFYKVTAVADEALPGRTK